MFYDDTYGVRISFYGIFFYQDWVATTGVPDLPFAGGSHRPKNLKNPKQKNKKKIIIPTLIHTFAYTLLRAPGAMSPNRLSAT